MTNPLAENIARRQASGEGWIGAAPGMTFEDMHQWVADKNEWVVSINLGWWWFVTKSKVSGAWIVERAEGPRAAEMRARAAGRHLEQFKPSPDEARAIHRRVAELIARGIEPEEFRAMVRRGTV